MARSLPPRVCDVCASRYQPARVTSKYCSDRCRKRAQRAHLAEPRTPREEQPVAPRRHGVGPVTAAVLEELRAADRHGSALGQACLTLAARVDAGQAESGSALAALNRELRATLLATLQAGAAPSDALDEIARKRQERLAAAR